MVVLSLGKKRYGKTALLRKLVFRRLSLPSRPVVWLFDTGCQIVGGRVFDDASGLAVEVARGQCPQFAIVRGGEVEPLAELALRVGNLTLWVDELDRACDDKRWISESVRKIVHEGRHRHIDLFGSFRSTRNVSEDLVNASDVVFLFHTSSAAVYDLQTIKARFGQPYADAVLALPQHRFVVWTDDL